MWSKYSFQKQTKILLAKPAKILNRYVFLHFYNSNDLKGCKWWIDSCPFKQIPSDHSLIITWNSVVTSAV